MSQTQNEAILKWLKSGKTLSQAGAINLFSCYRLASRIHDLREKGHNIEDVGEKNFSVYKLILESSQTARQLPVKEPIEGSIPSSPVLLSEPPKVFFDSKKKDQQVFNLGI